MFKIRIIYDETVDNKDDPQDFEILFINCEKNISCLLDNQKIEKFITAFVTNMVFRYIGLFCIIQSNKNLTFEYQKHCPSWILNGS